MIQIREEYGVIYVRIISDNEMFLHTYRTIRAIKGVTYKAHTGEFMVDPEYVSELIRLYNTHIVWMTPLRDLVKKFKITRTPYIKQYLEMSKDKEFDTFKMKLYPYQLIGAKFLAKRGCAMILDGVGLGKTSQTIGASHLLRLQHLESGSTKPFKTLVVTLNSIKRQWASEVEKFTPYKAIASQGDKKKRRSIIEEFKKRDDLDYLVVNYEMLRDKELLKLLQSIGFDVAILDEGQRIKSGVTDKRHRIEPSQVATGAYHLAKTVKYRFIATATPMQGKLEELFSLFHFIDPKILGDWYSFCDNFCDTHPKFGIMGYRDTHLVYQQIAPFFIRRTKEMPEIQQQLPAVSHEQVRLEMSDEQKKLTDYLRNEIATLKEESKKVSGPKMFGVELLSEFDAKQKYDDMIQGYQTFLASITDAPYLLHMSESNIANKIMAESGVHPKKKISPKIEYLKEFLSQVYGESDQTKVIIFSRFERMTQLIKEELGPSAVTFTGSDNDKSRQEAVERFWNDPSVRVFIGTEAASTGMNLQCARYLIHVDMNYDPTIMEQRNGRIDRTGNPNRNITIMYLIHEDSFDEDVLRNHKKKNTLRSDVLTGGADNLDIQMQPS
ncbi:DEAD/DEAH box helicase [Rhodococcus sp. IEGM1300]